MAEGRVVRRRMAEEWRRKIQADTLTGIGHAFQYSITSGVAFIVMILFDVILIPKMGLSGTAVASSISYLGATAFIIFLYVRLTGISYKDLLIPRKSDFLIYKKWLSQITHKRTDDATASLKQKQEK